MVEVKILPTTCQLNVGGSDKTDLKTRYDCVYGVIAIPEVRFELFHDCRTD